eukprot:TRINITY_DN5352_c0_g1_i1.p1 TRINITY_DN5352_c0_g1~~TRINITY_DN5352_c0_g1_i1.p1  ORF type:complete len:454 (-),score=37.84 TRINITY_DN5352_c0_g1_i1:247-1608(-)
MNVRSSHLSEDALLQDTERLSAALIDGLGLDFGETNSSSKALPQTVSTQQPAQLLGTSQPSIWTSSAPNGLAVTNEKANEKPKEEKKTTRRTGNSSSGSGSSGDDTPAVSSSNASPPSPSSSVGGSSDTESPTPSSPATKASKQHSTKTESLASWSLNGVGSSSRDSSTSSDGASSSTSPLLPHNPNSTLVPWGAGSQWNMSTWCDGTLPPASPIAASSPSTQSQLSASAPAWKPLSVTMVSRPTALRATEAVPRYISRALALPHAFKTRGTPAVADFLCQAQRHMAELMMHPTCSQVMAWCFPLCTVKQLTRIVEETAPILGELSVHVHANPAVLSLLSTLSTPFQVREVAAALECVCRDLLQAPLGLQVLCECVKRFAPPASFFIIDSAVSAAQYLVTVPEGVELLEAILRTAAFPHQNQQLIRKLLLPGIRTCVPAGSSLASLLSHFAAL